MMHLLARRAGLVVSLLLLLAAIGAAWLRA